MIKLKIVQVRFQISIFFRNQRVIQDKQDSAVQAELLHDIAVVFIKNGIKLTGRNDILHTRPDPVSQFRQLRIHVKNQRKLVELKKAKDSKNSVTFGLIPIIIRCHFKRMHM